MSKAEVFDLFYGKQMVTRSGGGTSKSKMTRKTPGFEEIERMWNSIKDKPEMLKYFNKLRDRPAGLAPPPKPTATVGAGATGV